MDTPPTSTSAGTGPAEPIAEPVPADVDGLLAALELTGAKPVVPPDAARFDLARSMTHRSYAYEHGGLPHNERLEFLGDSVLGVVVTEALYREHPDLPEGRLAKLRASVVNMRALAGVARGVGPSVSGLGAFVLLGRGEEATGGRDKASILADCLEAVIGAVHLVFGPAAAIDLVHRLFDPLLADVAAGIAGIDWKTSLQEMTAELSLGVPEYRISSTGPDHAKRFTAFAVVDGERFGSADGLNKKEAEQAAAHLALDTLRSLRSRRADEP
jgi:ribonuclease III